MKYLILKLPYHAYNVPFNNAAALLKEANGVEGWRITPTRLHDVEHAILLFRGQILEEYHINEVITYNKDERRCKFDMKPVKNSGFKGKMMSDYKTPNSASILEFDKLEMLVQ